MDQLGSDEMPLNFYTLIHRDAELSEADKQMMYGYCQKIIDTIKVKYQADSLILKREKWHEQGGCKFLVATMEPDVF